jgi:hypothetical protein
MFMETEPNSPPPGPRRAVSDVPAEEDYAYPPPRHAVSASASLAAILGNFEVETPTVATFNPAVESSEFTSPFINEDLGTPMYERTAADDADPYESLRWVLFFLSFCCASAVSLPFCLSLRLSFLSYRSLLSLLFSGSSLPSFTETSGASFCSTIDMDEDDNASVVSASSLVSEEQVYVVQSAINNMDLHSRLGIMESLRRLSQGQSGEAARAMVHRTSDTWVREHVLKAQSAEHDAAVAAAQHEAAVAEVAATKASKGADVFVGFSQSFEPSKRLRAQGPYTFTE